MVTGGWIQGDYYKKGIGRCAEGALIGVRADEGCYGLLKEACGNGKSITLYNDSHTKREVLARFTEAIRLAKDRENL